MSSNTLHEHSSKVVAMAARSPYTGEIRETAKLVAERLGHRSWSIAYQSRSGGPNEP